MARIRVYYQFQSAVRMRYHGHGRAVSPIRDMPYFKHQQSNNESSFLQKENSFRMEVSQKRENIRYSQSHIEREDKRKPLTVFEKLYDQAQSRLNRLRNKVNDSESQKIEEYSFVPQINSRRNRQIENNFLERGEVWLEMRKKDQMDFKQQELIAQLKDCTFSPILNHKACQYYLQKREERIKSQSKAASKTPPKKKKEQVQDYKMAKQQLQSRLRTMHV